MILGYRWWKFVVLSPLLIVLFVVMVIDALVDMAMEEFFPHIDRWGKR